MNITAYFYCLFYSVTSSFLSPFRTSTCWCLHHGQRPHWLNHLNWMLSENLRCSGHLWIPRALTCKKLCNMLFRLGFLFAHLQITQRKSKWAMNLLSWGLLTVIKYEAKRKYWNKRIEPAHQYMTGALWGSVWSWLLQNVLKQGATEVNSEDNSSKPLIYICYTVIWNGLFLSELQGKDN